MEKPKWRGPWEDERSPRVRRSKLGLEPKVDKDELASSIRRKSNATLPSTDETQENASLMLRSVKTSLFKRKTGKIVANPCFESASIFEESLVSRKMTPGVDAPEFPLDEDAVDTLRHVGNGISFFSSALNKLE